MHIKVTSSTKYQYRRIYVYSLLNRIIYSCVALVFRVTIVHTMYE